MSVHHRAAKERLEAARREVELLSRLPLEDKYPVGTVLTWSVQGSSPRVAVKTSDQYWNSTGMSGSHVWDSLMSNFRTTEDLEYFMVATEFKDATVTPKPPPLEMASDGNSRGFRDGYRFSLHDTVTGTTWWRKGDEWVKSPPD